MRPIQPTEVSLQVLIQRRQMPSRQPTAGSRGDGEQYFIGAENLTP